TTFIDKAINDKQVSVRKVLRAVRAKDDETNIGIRTSRPITAATSSNVRKVKDMARRNHIRNTVDIIAVCNLSKTSSRHIIAKASLSTYYQRFGR
ncbi:Hypothetical protein FKW44_011342, partial [Caligus rogercresseyi]